MRVKVIQLDLKQYTLVVPVIIPNLKDRLVNNRTYFPCYIMLTPKRYLDTQFELLHYLTKFHPIQSKRVLEKEANMFCFPRTLWPPAEVKVTGSDIKW